MEQIGDEKMRQESNMIGRTLLIDAAKRHGLKVSLVGFRVNEWGSAQYGEALDIYNVLNALSAKLRDKRAAMRELGITVRYSCMQRNPTVAVREWLKAQVKPLDEHLIGLLSIGWDPRPALGRWHPKTYDELLLKFRMNGWDLWCAAPVVASIAFKGLRVDAMNAPGIGPSANVTTQSQNYRTGVCCWLLAQAGLARKDSFGNFDT
jgi:hypothetical protein